MITVKVPITAMLVEQMRLQSHYRQSVNMSKICSNSCYASFHKSHKKYSAWNSYIFHKYRTYNLYRTIAGNRHFVRYMHLYTVG